MYCEKRKIISTICISALYFSSLSLLLTLLSLVGLLFNGYIVFAILYTARREEPRLTSPSIVFLLNLGLANSVLTAAFLCLSAPSLVFDLNLLEGEGGEGAAGNETWNAEAEEGGGDGGEVRSGIHSEFFTLPHNYVSFSFLCFAQEVYVSGGGGVLCVLQGALVTLLHPLIVWNLAGIHLDRFVSIVYPLR